MPQNSSPSPGLLVVIEGIDGTGKSTQAKALATWLREQGHDAIASREPTDGPWGRKIRATAATGRLSPAEELDYFLCDRREHVAEIIAPALAAGKIVVLDRYYFSTMAYQGSRGVDPGEIRRTNEDFAPVPDLLLILDLDVDTALQRIGSRGDTANEFEQRGSLARCREIFLSLRAEPFVHIVPTDAPPEVVQQRLQEIVGSKI